MRVLASAILVCALVFSSGCGRYGPPVAPEALAPQAVPDLQVQGTTDGVTFSWRSSETDQRGKELLSLDGYRIYRAQKPQSIDKKSAEEKAEEPEFTLVGTLEDTHLSALQKARAEARAAGKPSRRIRPDENLMKFSFVDTEVSPGVTYLYKVVPVNQGDVESDAYQLVQVLWKGESSQIALVDRSTIDVGTEELES